MPVVTGSLTDVGLGHLNGLNPQIIFELNGPNISGERVFATRASVTDVDSGGDFVVSLTDTTVMHRDAWYTMIVRWHEPGRDGSGGYVPVDYYLDHRIRVPSSGGRIGDLILGGLTNLTLVYVSLEPPTFKWPGLLWLADDPLDRNDPRNTSILYRWENV